MLQQAQSAFNEPSSSGLASELSTFWNAWASLSDSPTLEAKQGVVAAGVQLADSFNELSAQLTTISTQATEQYEALAGPNGEVQDDAEPDRPAQRADQDRRRSRPAAQRAMLDRRDLLIDKLSSLAQVTVTEEPDHMDTVTFGDAAKPLVEGHDRQLAADAHRSRRRAARRPARR